MYIYIYTHLHIQIQASVCKDFMAPSHVGSAQIHVPMDLSALALPELQLTRSAAGRAVSRMTSIGSPNSDLEVWPTAWGYRHLLHWLLEIESMSARSLLDGLTPLEQANVLQLLTWN